VTTSSPTHPISFCLSLSFFFFFLHFFFLLFFFLLSASLPQSHGSIPIITIHQVMASPSFSCRSVSISLVPLRLHLSLAHRHPSLASPNSLVPSPLASLASLSLSAASLSLPTCLPFSYSLSHSVSVISFSLLVSFCLRLKIKSLRSEE
jgi:hypothetical protein